MGRGAVSSDLPPTASGGVPKLTGRGPEQGQASGQPELPVSPEMAWMGTQEFTPEQQGLTSGKTGGGRGLFLSLPFETLGDTLVCSSRSANHTPECNTHFIPALQMGKLRLREGSSFLLKGKSQASPAPPRPGHP